VGSSGAGSSKAGSGKALGRGLSALIGERAEGSLREVPVDEIVASRRQPRQIFSEDELDELAASVRHLGVVQPVVLRPLAVGAAPGATSAGDPPGVAGTAPRYELIAGERRLRAARLAGLKTIPALVRSADDMASLEIALAENVARQDLNGMEEAHAFAALVDEFGLTHERVAELVGKSRVAVTNTIRLLELPDEVQQMVEAGALTEGHGRALLGLPDHDERRRAARLVVKQGLTVRQTEALARKLAEGGGTAADKKTAGPEAAAEGYIAELTDELYGLFEAPVRIRTGARGGRLEIAFKDRAELERLVELMRRLDV
jgi:ParB family transcriptional regulator, chromosome partitioning protein